MSLLAYATGGSLLIAAALGAMWQITEAKLDAEIAYNVVKDEQIVTLKGAVANQQNTIDAGKAFATLGVKTIATITDQLAQSDARGHELQRVLVELRDKEEQNAISDPQGRARASRSRLCDVLLLASSTGVVPGCDSPGNVAANNKSTP